MAAITERAVLAGGCFWGMQELLRHRDGVISTRVGYTGGQNENPTDGNHPGHAEAVEVVFDPERTSYRTSWSSSSRSTTRRPGYGAAVLAQLKSQGYRFVGPTSVYAFMQNVGVVNDHPWMLPRDDYPTAQIR